jgi:hypothetical protein
LLLNARYSNTKQSCRFEQSLHGRCNGFGLKICEAVSGELNINETTDQVWGYGKKILPK